MTHISAEEPQIRPLGAGEERWLQTVHRPDGNRNDILLRHRLPGDDVSDDREAVRFVAIIRATDDLDDGSPSWAWQSGETEREVYIRVAEAYANATPPPSFSVALHPDIEWFINRIP